MLIVAALVLVALIVTVVACIAASPLFRTVTRAIDSCAEGPERRGSR